MPSDRAPHWDKPLARPIDLKVGPGVSIRTLRAARDLFTLHFATRSRTVLAAIDRLRRAAESGRAAGIETATDSVECVLRARG